MTELASVHESLDDAVAALIAQTPGPRPDRWSVYERLRTEAPVHPFRDWLLVSRYDDVSEVLRDDRRFGNGPFAGGPPKVPEGLTADERRKADEVLTAQGRWITSANGERHRALRSLVARVFTPRVVAEMQARIERASGDLLDDLAQRGECDFVSDFAYKLPLAVISEMLDIGVDDRERLHDIWVGMAPSLGSEWRYRLPDQLDSVHRHYAEMADVLGEVLASRRGRSNTDLVSRLLEASLTDEALLTEDDLVAVVVQLFAGGHQTTQDLLSTGLHALLTHPDEWEALRVDPGLIPNAVEEMLRFRSPAQDMERTALVDCEIAGVRVAAGQRVLAIIGSANRDPEQFDHPERFDVARDDAKRHIAFSRGPHFCVGAALSRLEARIVLEQLVDRHPGARLLDDEPDWVPHSRLLSLASLPVQLVS